MINPVYEAFLIYVVQWSNTPKLHSTILTICFYTYYSNHIFIKYYAYYFMCICRLIYEYFSLEVKYVNT